MLALSPSWFSATGLPVDDGMIHDHVNWVVTDSPFSEFANREGGAFDPYTPVPEISMDDTKLSSLSGDDSLKVKKLSHNANERDRRKKLNNLYSSLRSMLPGLDPKKKLSIPATVSYVLKYIPELQNQIEDLKLKREKMLSKISSQGDLSCLRNSRSGSTSALPYPTISVREVGYGEVAIQICSIYKDGERRSSLSSIVQGLEKEGLCVLNAASFSIAEDRDFHHLHLQVKDSVRMECEMVREKLLFFYGNLEEGICPSGN